MTIFALLIACIISALVPFVLQNTSAIRTGALITSTVVFGVAIYAVSPALLGASIHQYGGYWYVDALAALMVLLISCIQWTATLTSIPYLTEEEREGVVGISEIRRYYFLSGLFVFSMLLTVVSNNLGFMWIALEATTLATTLLVAFYRQKGSLEAAWKYLILCSTGISLGLIGLFLTYYAATSTGLLSGLAATNWTDLLLIAPSLPPAFMRVVFVFILIGYGTKVGLVPMHAWLPDAHSRAPAPISGMLSGILLNTALFAILRFRSLVDGTLGSASWTSELLLCFGVLSCLVSAAFILLQTDYKRLLAYSSIEHMGLIVFSLGLGAGGSVAAIIHMVGHALAKSGLFFAAGNILLRFRSTKFERVGGVLRTLPYTGALFLTLMLGLLAVPPSPLFASELFLISRGIVFHPILTSLILFALAVIAAGFVRLLVPLLLLRGNTSSEHVKVGERWNLAHAAVVFHIALLIAFGISLVTPTTGLIIERIVAILS